MALQDLTAGDVPLRLHAPEAPGHLPGLVYLHGGGWTSGSAAGIDELCGTLAHDAQCVVAAVDYRLAPEHPFPAGLDDCFAATAWLAEHGAELGVDTAKLAVGGGSAGANLAAAVTLLARDRGGPPLAFQLLVYPPMDHAALADDERATFRRADIKWHWSQYLPRRSDGDDPRASPLRAADLSGLPPALVITAEHDPLTEEAEAYARRLLDAGVPAAVHRFAGAQHGFFASATPQGKAARAVTAAALRTAFGTS
jgi:acetyl esterase